VQRKIGLITPGAGQKNKIRKVYLQKKGRRRERAGRLTARPKRRRREKKKRTDILETSGEGVRLVLSKSEGRENPLKRHR